MKRILYNKYFMLMCVFALLSTSCSKLDDLRKDPESVSNAIPSSFLSNALYSVASSLSTQGHTINDQLIQVSVLKQNDNEIHRYKVTPGNSNGMWNALYTPANNFSEMYKLAIKGGDNNYAAIALTLRAWTISNITDIYGDIPYTEAMQGATGNITPAYDTQKQVYESLLASLDQANDLYVLTKGLSGEDLLYGANVAANMIKWKKFTNSLRLRLLMRIEKKSVDYQNMIKSMLSNPAKYPLMTSVGDGAALYYSGITPFLSPFFGYRDFDFNEKLNFSAYFISYLSSVNDPRLYVWAKTGTGNVYEGLQTGYPISQQSVISNRGFSSYLPSLKTSKLMGTILQYAEVEFLLAEACLKGYMTDNAQSHYEKGIKASMDYWGVTSIPSSFSQHVKIAYNGTLEQVITQKYFALFANGFEQWSEYRRTSYPVLPPGIEMENNGKMPSRIPYPAVESLYNGKSYSDAVARIGADDINTKVWWMQ